MVSTFPIGQPAQRQHIVHILNGDDLKTIPRLLWYILEILHILCRDQYLSHTSTLRSHKLFRKTSDGCYLSPQRNLTGHGNIRINCLIRNQRGNSCDECDACRRPVFGRRAIRHVDVKIIFLKGFCFVRIARRTDSFMTSPS